MSIHIPTQIPFQKNAKRHLITSDNDNITDLGLLILELLLKKKASPFGSISAAKMTKSKITKDLKKHYKRAANAEIDALTNLGLLETQPINNIRARVGQGGPNNYSITSKGEKKLLESENEIKLTSHDLSEKELIFLKILEQKKHHKTKGNGHGYIMEIARLLGIKETEAFEIKEKLQTLGLVIPLTFENPTQVNITKKGLNVIETLDQDYPEPFPTDISTLDM